VLITIEKRIVIENGAKKLTSNRLHLSNLPNFAVPKLLHHLFSTGLNKELEAIEGFLRIRALFSKS